MTLFNRIQMQVAELLNVPKEFVTVQEVLGTAVWLNINGVEYTCTMSKNGKKVIKNSLRGAV